ncbi:MAG: fructosamine kinase family protein [Coleofasciculaceae cyanobacterium SM2_1_6]|nr:fructosamine kinase family protein [Coleofasciculaceae cyanobacterium SM2_1_6]
MWQQISQHLGATIQQQLTILGQKSVAGGCINQNYTLQTNLGNYFVKLNQASLIEMFVAEAKGLLQMQATGTIKVPRPICYGTVNDRAYLVLEYLDLSKNSSQDWSLMGEKLAAMHRFPVANLRLDQHLDQYLDQQLNQRLDQQLDQGFGWVMNNTIGSTPQINPWTKNWAKFFAEERISYQMQLAQRRGGQFPAISKVVEAVYQSLINHQPQPSLVHGDLWGGNAAITKDGEPVIFDPATYVGDREVDLAMTKLFGGFPKEFYQGYHQAFPLPPGYAQRENIYNLYHILNHFNLFGGGYAHQAKEMINEILVN